MFFDYTKLEKLRVDFERELRAAGDKYLNAEHKGLFPFGISSIEQRYNYKGPDPIDAGIDIARNSLPEVAAEFSQKLDDALRAVGAVDTGELLRSKSVVITRDGIEVTYDAPYAALVRFGGFIQPYGNPNARPVDIPGRDWVTLAWENMAF